MGQCFSKKGEKTMSYVDFKYALLRTSCSLAVMVILVMTLLSTLVQADNQAGYVSHASILLADNGQADAFAQSARTKAIQGDYTGAMADINMALQCDANHLGAIALRAFIRKKQGDKEGALQDYNKVHCTWNEGLLCLYEQGKSEEGEGRLCRCRGRSNCGHIP